MGVREGHALAERIADDESDHGVLRIERERHYEQDEQTAQGASYPRVGSGLGPYPA
jgi:hypothetical protein